MKPTFAFTFSALFVVVVLARAQQPAQPPSMPPIEQLYKMPAVYSVPGMDKVQVRRDIVYKTVESEKGKVELKFDWYAPADLPAGQAGAKPGKTYPTVILISGGGIEGAPYDWRDAGVYNSYGRILAASGFVAIAYSKRYAPGPSAELGISDTRDFLSYLRDRATDLHIDKDRFAYWAFSGGGGVLASILAESAPATRAVICFYCITEANTTGLSPEDAERRRRTFSSVYQVQQGGHPFPPLFIGRAGLDNPFLNAGLDSLVAAALAKNLSIDVMNHSTGRHGFDILDDNARSKEIIRRALDFLRERFEPAAPQ